MGSGSRRQEGLRLGDSEYIVDYIGTLSISLFLGLKPSAVMAVKLGALDGA